jgi:hypothetical protein
LSDRLLGYPGFFEQTIFHSDLPAGTSLLVVFVPSKDRSGVAIDQDHWVTEVLQTVGRMYRGSTAYPRGRGVWRDDARGGVLVMEEPVIVFSYISQAELTVASLEDLYKTLSRVGRATNQDEIGVVIDGRYYGIPEIDALEVPGADCAGTALSGWATTIPRLKDRHETRHECRCNLHRVPGRRRGGPFCVAVTGSRR